MGGGNRLSEHPPKGKGRKGEKRVSVPQYLGLTRKSDLLKSKKIARKFWGE